MFTIRNNNKCKTKSIKTAVQTGIGINSNLFFSNGVVQTNSSNQSVPNLSCIINSTKEKLTYDLYDAARNIPTPIPPPIPFCIGTPFIIQINTNNTSVGSSSNNQFMLPLVSTGVYNFIIDWGDGSSTNKIYSYGYQNVTHTYSLVGIYTVTIRGTFTGWSFNNTGDRLKLLDIIQWGSCLCLGNQGSHFYGCANMNISATDYPNFGETTSLSSCFRGCSIMNSPNLIGWDVSNVTNMTDMFRDASLFNNGEINTINGVTPSLCTSTSSGGILTCPSIFNINVGDALLVPNASTVPRRSAFVVTNVNITTTPGSTLLTLLPAIGANVVGQIYNVQKVIPYNSTLPSVTPLSSSYSNATKTLTCPGATFISSPSININDTLWIVTTTTVYITTVQSIPNNTDLVVTGFGANITAGSIRNIQKPPAGTNPLTWNTSNVTDMSTMFRSAFVFNQSLSSFNTSNVTNMSEMFRGAFSFNQPLSTFDTSNVTNIGGMFNEAKMFNQPLNTWNTSNLTNMGSLFQSAVIFNQNINNWDTSKVTFMNNTFQSTLLFNEPLDNWNTSNVTIMGSMFFSNPLFNQNLNSWDVSNVTNMAGMFLSVSLFNNGGAPGTSAVPLTWKAHKCLTFNNTFARALAFNQKIDTLVDTSSVTSCDLGSMFITQSGGSTFNQNLNSWDVSNVTNMAGMFQVNTSFNNNGVALTWDVSNVTNMSNMFFSGIFNNGGASGTSAIPLTWYAPKCTNFSFMFSRNTGFNQKLDTLVDTTNVISCDLSFMFSTLFGSSTFNQNLNSWDVCNVTNMAGMFQINTSFNNGGVALTWSAPKCLSFASMFQQATAFNQPITNLVNTSGVASCAMNSMFQSATLFNQNIGSWDVSKVTTMASMFQGATLFNQNIGGWNTINVTTMVSMFLGTTTNATQFNNGQPSGTVPGTAPLLWNTSKVTTMASMFQYCLAFNQPISKSGLYWDTSLVTTVAAMFNGINGTTGIHLFNNGKAALDETAPLNWTFPNPPNPPPTNTNWRTNSRLTRNAATFNNAKTTPQLP